MPVTTSSPVPAKVSNESSGYAFREPGPVLLSYRNGYIPEASLPLRYLSNEGDGVLSLTVLCKANEESVQWDNMKGLASSYVSKELGQDAAQRQCIVWMKSTMPKRSGRHLRGRAQSY